MKNGLAAAGEKLLSRAGHALEHHPKQFTAALVALMLGATGGSFAVASLTPEDTGVRVRQIIQDVQPLPVEPQLKALENHSFRLFRTESTRGSDTVDSLLARLGVDDAAAAIFLRGDASFRSQVLGRVGRSVTAESADDRSLQRLTVRWTPVDDGMFRRLVIERGADGQFASRIDVVPLAPSVRMGSAVVRTSLFAAADEYGIPDGVVVQLAELFSADIDFRRDLRQGDTFSVVYEVLEADGEPMRSGRILSAQFVNHGERHEAIWFQPAGRKGGYYTPEGRSLETSYLASPMEFTRVSSGFKMRMHPILHEWKAHLGVDYAAPTGTPVRTVGEGIVEFAGTQNGFGNVVIVKHTGVEQTVYAHLSRIEVRAGQSVAQGQTIGAVGQTGWATGPHLHFEFRVNGVHQNPSQMAHRHEAAPLSAEVRPAFDRVARSMQAQLAAASQNTRIAKAE